MAQENGINTLNQRVEITIQPCGFGRSGSMGLPAGQYAEMRQGGVPVHTDMWTGTTTVLPQMDLPPGIVPMSPTGEDLGYPYPPISTPEEIKEREKSVDGKQEKKVAISVEEKPEGEARSDSRNVSLPVDYHVARPPPQVMTALGPIPLPAEIREKIPEKFVAKPIIEEREIYVAKKEVQERTIEIPHVQYEHRFTEVQKALTVDKFVPVIKEVVREIPREIYKPVIEEKIIEVPQGVKYVEVPVEVPCMYPPKIVPKPVTQYVERVVETVKPVVKENIIEVPQTVVKQIPKIKTVEVPYYVPVYKEKIIEIPYTPPAAADFPFAYTGDSNLNLSRLPGMPTMFPPSYPGGAPGLPGSFMGGPPGLLGSFMGGPASPFTVGPIPFGKINEIKLPYEAKIEVQVTYPEKGVDTSAGQVGINGLGLGKFAGDGTFASGGGPFTPGGGPFPAGGGPFAPGGGFAGLGLDGDSRMPGCEGFENVKLPHGFKWGAPPNVQVPRGTFLQKNACFFQYPGKTQAPPLMVTCPPEVGNVSFASYLCKPDILTRAGVLPYDSFKATGNPEMLFPPLPIHPLVPMQPPPAEPGTPDVRTLDKISGVEFKSPQADNILAKKLQYQREMSEAKKGSRKFFNSTCFDSSNCGMCGEEDGPFRDVSDEPQ